MRSRSGSWRTRADLEVCPISLRFLPTDMRLAFFSPLPPARSGIADYSAALLDPLRSLATLTAFSNAEAPFDRAAFDLALYQLGNNPDHGFAYEQALRHPGVVALHESNLHHLIAHLTIGRGDWDAYVEECAYNGGPEAGAFAERVRAREIGPDYEGVPMLRRLLESARGVIVHSRFMEREIRATGYAGALAVIPHGAWLAPGSRNDYRLRLGLDETTPLAGIFGHLKPYKRIPESLRAFRRLTRVVPEAKLILAGEPHPDLPLAALIESLGLSHAVRVLGFTEAADFAGYLSACDAVLNLRFPTVGESSGTLMRAMGLGIPPLVSDVGSFAELPETVCLKVPAGAGEEDAIYEYLNLLLSRPDAARAIGARARDYAAHECSWDLAARRYVEFLESVAKGPGPVEQASWPATPTSPSARGAASGTGGLSRLPPHLGRGRRLARLSRCASHAVREDPGDDSAGRPVRPHSGNGRLSPDHACAGIAAGLWRSARLLLRRARPVRSSCGRIERG